MRRPQTLPPNPTLDPSGSAGLTAAHTVGRPVDSDGRDARGNMPQTNRMLDAWNTAVACWRVARDYDGRDYDGIGAASHKATADRAAREWRAYLPATLVSPAAVANGA